MPKRLFSGLRPDLTPAQGVALLIVGVPVLANLLHAFGVFSATPEQQDALTQAIRWGGVVAGVLIGGDAGLRSARNHADAKVQAVIASQSPSAATGDPVAWRAATATRAEIGTAPTAITEETEPPTEDELRDVEVDDVEQAGAEPPPGV